MCLEYRTGTTFLVYRGNLPIVSLIVATRAKITENSSVTLLPHPWFKVLFFFSAEEMDETMWNIHQNIGVWGKCISLYCQHWWLKYYGLKLMWLITPYTVLVRASRFGNLICWTVPNGVWWNRLGSSWEINITHFQSTLICLRIKDIITYAGTS